MKNRIFTRILEVIPFAMVFIVTFRYPITPDFGWHLKNGEFLISEGKIVDTNIYSTLMDGFNYVNISWLLDGIHYLIFNNLSFIGIGLISAIIFTLIYLVLSLIGKLDFWQKMIVFPVILFLGDIFTRNSFQGQSISILFLALVVYLLTIFRKKEKLVFVLVPFLMLIWTQIHAQFVVGLVIIGSWIISLIINDFIRKRKLMLVNYIKPLLLLFISFLITIINPYGPLIYREIFAHFGFSYTLSGVIEWASPFEESITTVAYVGMLSIYLSGIGYLAYQKKLTDNLFIILFPLIFVIQATFQMRYLFISMFLIIPLFGIMVGDLRPKLINTQRNIAFITLVILYFCAIYLFPINAFLRNNWDYFCVVNACSDNAAKFIIDNHLQKNIYTEYSFGGWLIWNYFSEIKPVIDGRMHMWNNNGYSGFEDYAKYMENTESINRSNYNTVYIINKGPIYTELQKLVSEGKWSLVYEEELSAIFIRN